MTDAPNPAPPSACEMLRRLDTMIAIMAHWRGKRSKLGILMTIWREYLVQMRPHIEAAAERSNARDD
jgi:hypothetical protein